MELTELSVKLVLLFLPGIVALLIIEALTTHRQIAMARFLIYSFILGCLSYLLYYPITLIDCLGWDIAFFSGFTKNIEQQNVWEISRVTVVSVILALFLSRAINNKWLFRVAHRLSISWRFGDEDVWAYVMNSDMPPWVVVRDFDRDLMYKGWIEVFSDTGEPDELLLRDVKVFKNSTAEKLYVVPAMYISRSRGCFHVEFPVVEDQ